MTEPSESLFDFLRLDFREVQQRYGGVYGLKVRRPKLIPCRDGVD
jgi:hypothetical protein